MLIQKLKLLSKADVCTVGLFLAKIPYNLKIKKGNKKPTKK